MIENLINQYLAKARRFVSDDESLMSGNCGTFAIALHKALLNQGYVSDICVITNAEEERDLFFSDVDIYHVFVYAQGLYIDGDGVFEDADHMVEWIDEEYHSPNMSLFTFEKPEIDKRFETMIRSNTNYTISVDTFYRVINEKANPERKD